MELASESAGTPKDAPKLIYLRLVDRERAASIVARQPLEGDLWAEGYPTDGDVQASEMLLKSLRHRRDPGDFGVYEVLEADSLRAVGGIGFHRPPGRDGVVEVGYGLVESVWNRGYATAALQAMVEVARRGGARRIEGRAVPDNLASRRVMEKAGLHFQDIVDGYTRYRLDFS